MLDSIVCDVPWHLSWHVDPDEGLDVLRESCPQQVQCSEYCYHCPQTLTDKEYQRLRDAAVAIIREMGVECGGSNVQMGINPVDGELLLVFSRQCLASHGDPGCRVNSNGGCQAAMLIFPPMPSLEHPVEGQSSCCRRTCIGLIVLAMLGCGDSLSASASGAGEMMIIEMNPGCRAPAPWPPRPPASPSPRSPPSWPWARPLDMIPNDITSKTPASFEPSIDYVVTKVPLAALMQQLHDIPLCLLHSSWGSSRFTSGRFFCNGLPGSRTPDRAGRCLSVFGSAPRLQSCCCLAWGTAAVTRALCAHAPRSRASPLRSSRAPRRSCPPK